MSPQIRRSYPVRQKAHRVLLAGVTLAALIFSVQPSIASASNFYSGKNLPGHTYTTGNGVFLYPEGLISAVANTTSSVCVGPVTVSGGKVVIPYGWSCNPHSVTWEFAAINAAAGIDNPNPGTFGEYEVYAN
jgi:hypothetical protein